MPTSMQVFEDFLHFSIVLLRILFFQEFCPSHHLFVTQSGYVYSLLTAGLKDEDK